MLLKSLSNEVQVNCNGPNEFSKETTVFIEEALESHFNDKETGIMLDLMSSTIAACINKSSIYMRPLYEELRKSGKKCEKVIKIGKNWGKSQRP